MCIFKTLFIGINSIYEKQFYGQTYTDSMCWVYYKKTVSAGTPATNLQAPSSDSTMCGALWKLHLMKQVDGNSVSVIKCKWVVF